MAWDVLLTPAGQERSAKFVSARLQARIWSPGTGYFSAAVRPKTYVKIACQQFDKRMKRGNTLDMPWNVRTTDSSIPAHPTI